MLGFAGAQALRPPEAAEAASPSETIPDFRFRNYSLWLGARLLLRNGQPVELGGRAFDLLYVLLCARGTVVERLELMRRVWPTTVVEESNLRFQVACLRKALGADRDLIKSVAGRGYFFVAEPGDAAPGGGDNPFEAEHEPYDSDRPGSPLAQMSLPRDPTGAQTPEDYRASCELMRELLSAVLRELREMRDVRPG